METILKTPEEKLIIQGDKSDNSTIYFLAKGKCDVIFRESPEHKCTITSGMHFGEISMIYSCPRSATVNSRNYIIASTLNRKNYYELLSLYPNLKHLFVQQILKYREPLKIYMEMKLSRLNFFKNLPKHIKNEFIYNMDH